jgi:predicted CoA-binding protein
MDIKRKVAILGASDKSERYSNMLLKRLVDRGYEVFPINPGLKSIDGLKVYANLEALPAGIDVLSIYMQAERSDAIADSIEACGISKVVFNPGAENPRLQKRLADKGVDVQEACSLVLTSLEQI